MPVSIDWVAIKNAISHLGNLLLVNDWSLGYSLLVAATVYRFVKTSLHIALTIVFAGVIVSVLTHFGIIPPLNEILASFAH